MATSSQVTLNRSPTSSSACAPNKRPSTAGHDAQAGGEKSALAGQALFLMPGQWHFGGQAASVRTLLGSCVAVTLWHPVRHIGGMCHFLLPERRRAADAPLDGRYGTEAIEMMVKSLTRARCQPSEFVAHLYGGADTMPESSGVKFNVGERNIETGWALIDKHGFQLEGVDVGDHVPRTVTLTLATGDVHVKRGTKHT